MQALYNDFNDNVGSNPLYAVQQVSNSNVLYEQQSYDKPVSIAFFRFALSLSPSLSRALPRPRTILIRLSAFIRRRLPQPRWQRALFQSRLTLPRWDIGSASSDS